jgi:hypothetical protein
MIERFYLKMLGFKFLTKIKELDFDYKSIFIGIDKQLRKEFSFGNEKF